MKKIYPAILLVAAVLAVGLAPTLASAGVSGTYRGANSGTCKSGKKVQDVKDCKENGGKS